MDMKNILQALDSATSKPVEGSNGMKKYLEIVNESSSPHKVSTPVRMAMDFYQNKVEDTRTKPVTSTFNKYFNLVESESQQRDVERIAAIHEKASKIASKLQLCESEEKVSKDEAEYRSTTTGKKHCVDCKYFRKPNRCTQVQGTIKPRGVCSLYKSKMIRETVELDKIDTVTVDVPLLIRLLEYAREDAETDMDLHNVADQLIELSKSHDVLTMDNYDSIIDKRETD
jgi:hypothetical protein